MKQSQINRAYSALTKMINMELPAKDAFGIYALAKKLETNYSFEIDREKRLIEKYNGQIDKSGQISFKSEDDAIAFGNEVVELGQMEVDLEISPISVSIDSFGDQHITPNDILCLDGFVEFV